VYLLQRRWTVLLLAGLVPLATTLLAMVLWPVLIRVPILPGLVLMLAVPLANTGVGRIVGSRVLPRTFLTATGVAAAGWVVVVVGIGIAAELMRTPDDYTSAGGAAILATSLLFFGVVLSPIAGLVARSRARRPTSPAKVEQDTARP
jgi:hypothetical protein